MTNNSFNCRLSLCSVSSGKDLERPFWPACTFWVLSGSTSLFQLNIAARKTLLKASLYRAARSLLEYEYKTCHFLQHKVMNENLMVIKSDSSVLKKTKLCVIFEAFKQQQAVSLTFSGGLCSRSNMQGWVPSLDSSTRVGTCFCPRTVLVSLSQINTWKRKLCTVTTPHFHRMLSSQAKLS